LPVEFAGIRWFYRRRFSSLVARRSSSAVVLRRFSWNEAKIEMPLVYQVRAICSVIVLRTGIVGQPAANIF
jgi:hypothetical protein